ncbi:MAG: alpha/beta hydrolase [Pseudomonadota bacterium]|uniref:alpha/beta hydrolase n=1 Tax=Roseovarius TaxID=74030 RepID=UPI0022A84407|nr:alpha/beta hydrolase [Roseovarius sp. EGI FJ00037]MCZ0813351.1 alpha/beta hydrolase [Roseovarius sp. EGI FJ00037]
MPLLHINSGPDGPVLHAGPATPLGPALAQALRHGHGPVVIMTHGYKFAPGHGLDCPHQHILSLDPACRSWKAMSWPRGLGFGAGQHDEGTAIAFGWPGRGTIWQAYRQAEIAGATLARLIGMIARIAPDRPLHLLAHSLGARVVLGALKRLPEGRVARAILLSGAEFGSRAAEALSRGAGRSAEIINVTSRENDLFDFLLERLVAPPVHGDRSLGHGLPAMPKTLTLQLDHPDTLTALARAGFEIEPPKARICHWSSYLRPGVFPFYRALLRAPEALPLPQLRAALPAEPEPRWSRILRPPCPEIALPGWRRSAT